MKLIEIYRTLVALRTELFTLQAKLASRGLAQQVSSVEDALHKLSYALSDFEEIITSVDDDEELIFEQPSEDEPEVIQED